MKILFVASIIRYKLCMIYAFFDFFVQKSFLTKSYFITAEIDLTTWGLLYTCLVDFDISLYELKLCRIQSPNSDQASHPLSPWRSCKLLNSATFGDG